MKKALIMLLTILLFLGFTQTDSVTFFVLSKSDTTYLIGASFSDNIIGTQAFEYKTTDKIEIDSLKRRLVPFRIKNNIYQSPRFIKTKNIRYERDSILKTMVNAPIADFDAPDTEGFVHRPRNYRGRVLILHFWNFWDSSFDHEIPFFNKLLDKYRKDGLEILSFTDIGMGSSEKEHLAKHPINFTIIPNSRDFVSKFLSMTHSIPCLMVVDKQGLMRYFYIEQELGHRENHFYKDAEDIRSFEAQIISLLKGQ